MGAGFVRSVQSVVPSTEPGSAWSNRDIGPTLRRFFGAYYNGDVWAVYRRYKNIDVENTGWISYEELQEILLLPEFNLLFIFDVFNKQNALIDARELLVMVCLFSSAKLSEKCQVFTTLFDESHSGVCSGIEVAHYATVCLQVLGRCTGFTVKPKEILAAMQDELCDCLPAYREAANRMGIEVVFKEERIFGQVDVDKVCKTIMTTYEELPIGQDPPPGAVGPPVPDWGHASGSATAAAKSLASSYQPLNRRLTEQELAQMAIMGGLGDEDPDGSQAQALMKEQQAKREQERQAAAAAKAAIKPAKGFMVIHGADFVTISKDIPRFRHTFIKGVAQALDVASGLITIVDIVPGSVVVEFLIHPPTRGGDKRSATELLIALAEQLISSRSTLRRGHFRDFAASAELLVGQTRQSAVHPLAIGTGTICCDQAVQFCNPQSILNEVLARLEIEQKRAEAAEESHRQALLELRKRDESVRALKDLLERRRREEEERKAEEERDAEMKQFGEELRLLEEMRQLRQLQEQQDEHMIKFGSELDQLEEEKRKLEAAGLLEA
eukprot:gb/GFBE01009900.1/.p1 GENE.gb/GFBE01009900.1/~~gb/GFBE01009900.1/.p1  ORF type:complete len:554 (+),score=151.90 gb/GFBE01009900.1/:1-1662(+)